ncbi:MAG: chemotaxis protein CheB [Flavobacterium sp.]|nr:MAG: chemotaxis protein CheB [Flavobacterium sp.]
MRQKPFIIAIGASSGGIDALSEFFDYTLPDGVSYVITTHLFPEYKSHLTDIIQMRSRIDVCTVEHNMKIESNVVYVMPENKTMTIEDGYLILKPRDLAIKLNKAIDIFFKSLAEDTLYNKIAIILSGMGEDGTEGVKELKKKGAYIIAQTSLSSKHSSMPNSIVDSGLADIILQPSDMPTSILNWLKPKI